MKKYDLTGISKGTTIDVKWLNELTGIAHTELDVSVHERWTQAVLMLKVYIERELKATCHFKNTAKGRWLLVKPDSEAVTHNQKRAKSEFKRLSRTLERASNIDYKSLSPDERRLNDKTILRIQNAKDAARKRGRIDPKEMRKQAIAKIQQDPTRQRQSQEELLQRAVAAATAAAIQVLQ